MNNGFSRQPIRAANNAMNKESSKPATPEQQTVSDRSPLRVPDGTEHQYHAQDAETHRPVRLVPIQIQPGERAPVSLPYGGRTARQYLADCLSSEAAWYPDRDWNHTGEVITVYHGIWADTGNNTGYFWHKHLQWPTTAPSSA